MPPVPAEGRRDDRRRAHFVVTGAVVLALIVDVAVAIGWMRQQGRGAGDEASPIADVDTAA